MRYALLLLLAISCFGQEQKTPARAKRVIDEALQALGGDNYLAMKDRTEEGRAYSFYDERLSGMSRAKIYSRYLIRPEPPKPGFIGIRERQAMGKKEDVYIIFNEDGGFEVTYRGVKKVPDETLTRYREGLFHSILYTLRMRLGEPGLTFDSLGADIVENQPCEVVLVSDAENRMTKVWFNQSTKLPVKQYWDHRDPKTRERIEEVTIFDKFRDIGGGVMWPYVVRRERNGLRVFEMYDDEVAVNKGLTDEFFTVSGNIQVREEKSSNIKPGKK